MVTSIGLGCNTFGLTVDRAETKRIVAAALDIGITFFDTADAYGATQSESFLGDALRGHEGATVLLTKFGRFVDGAPDAAPGSRPFVRWAVAQSLRRLKRDRIDVYMLHWPDPNTPIFETIGYMAELVRDGLVASLGIGNVDAIQIREAHAAAKHEGVSLAAVQGRLSVLRREAEQSILPVCSELGIGFIAYYPLEGGVLTGKYTRGEAPPADSRFVKNKEIWSPEQWLADDVFDRLETLEAFAGAEGATLLEVALGGLLAEPAVTTAIAGATRPAQVRANAAAGRWRPGSASLPVFA